MRRAFAETLVELGEQNPRLALITGDLGFQVFDEFESRFGGRFVNVGVAEAQMVYTSVGMALEGWRPIAYSIASFATARPFEQIRFCVSYPNLPVVLVGAGRGYVYSTSGISHHAVDDMALMSVLPGMTVVVPGDPTEVRQLLPQVLELPGPAYFTVGRFGEPVYDAEEPAILGRARLLRAGERIAVLSAGEMANEVLKALELLEPEGIFPIAYQIHTVKPLDTDTLESLAERVDTIIIVEEHLPIGGLWCAVSLWKSTNFKSVNLLRIGPPDAYALGNVKRDDLRSRLKMDHQSIMEICRLSWERSSKSAG